MNNIQGLMDGMVRKNNELSLKIDELEGLGKAQATAEQSYNISYAKKLLSLTDAGTAIGTAKELAKGDKVVAGLLFDFRVSTAVYEACKKRIGALNTGIDTYRSLLSFRKQEYSQTA